MRRPAVIFLAALLFSCNAPDIPGPSRGGMKEAAEYLFDASDMPEIHISTDAGQWEQLLNAYDADNGTKEYVKCDLTLIKKDGSIGIPEAGLRLRGNTSRRRPADDKGSFHHCHYSLDLNHWHDNPQHTVRGIRRLDLKWFKDDPSYVREIYCYDLFRRFGVWTAVRDVYSRLWIRVGDGKEAYLGVYGMLEHIGKDYLAARKSEFGSDEGYLWKCSYGADLRRTSNDFGPDDDSRDRVYELKTRENDYVNAKNMLLDFIKQLNSLSGRNLYNWLESVTDIDLLLRTYAVNVAVGMWDDYWNNSNNYYLYFTPEGKMFFIPFDYDNTLGTSLRCGVQSDCGRQNPYKWGSNSNPLIYKVLMNDEWKARYRQYLSELTGGDGLSSPENARVRILEWQDRITSFVTNDTGEDMEIKDEPASWGNHPEYRITDMGQNNFFRVKAAAVAAMD